MARKTARRVVTRDSKLDHQAKMLQKKTKPGAILGRFDRVDKRVRLLEDQLSAINAIIDGSAVLSVVEYRPPKVSAAALNAADADSFKRKVTVELVGPGRRRISLSGLTLTVAVAKTVNDVDIGDLTLDEQSYTLTNGVATIGVVFDTDAGSTKTHAVDDTHKVTADLALLGNDLTQAVYEWTTIA